MTIIPLNTLGPEQNSCHFENSIIRCILLNENLCWLIFHWSWFLIYWTDNKSRLIQVMVWYHQAHECQPTSPTLCVITSAVFSCPPTLKYYFFVIPGLIHKKYMCKGKSNGIWQHWWGNSLFHCQCDMAFVESMHHTKPVKPNMDMVALWWTHWPLGHMV